MSRIQTNRDDVALCILDGRAAFRIPLTNRLSAIIDICDYPLVSRFTWTAHYEKRLIYVARREQVVPASQPDVPKRKWIFLHRLLLNPAPGELVDHINHDGLDNRRSNLRTCNKTQNTANQRARPGRNFKGIQRSGSKWAAYISNQTHAGKPRYLGIFDTPEAAALAYDVAAIERFGDFASLNFPEKFSDSFQHQRLLSC